jgi:hypothetical protein
MSGTTLIAWTGASKDDEAQASALAHWWTHHAAAEPVHDRLVVDLAEQGSSAFPSEGSVLLCARLHSFNMGKAHAYGSLGWQAIDSWMSEKASLLSALVVRVNETELPTKAVGAVNALLTKDQLPAWRERLDGLIAGLRRVGCSLPVLAYPSLDTLVVEVGPKERPLMLILDQDETVWSFRTYVDDFKEYATASIGVAPSDSELANVIATYSVQQACKPKKPIRLSQTKNLSAAAFTTASLNLS